MVMGVGLGVGVFLSNVWMSLVVGRDCFVVVSVLVWCWIEGFLVGLLRWGIMCLVKYGLSVLMFEYIVSM